MVLNMFHNSLPKAAMLLVMAAASALAHDENTALKAEFLANYDDVSKKIISLAEAVPADKYSYKPAEGVRSIAAVYVHLAGANIMIPNALGAKPPADMKMSRDSEKTMTDKAEIVSMLKKSMAHARTAISDGLDTPSKATKLFGRESTHSATSLLIISHMHEHLGQSIAYARASGVTPPWSMKGGE